MNIARFLLLFRFELKKVMARKKAILFLLALNVVPILSGLLGLLVYTRIKAWGLDPIKFTVLAKAVKGVFTLHMLFFSVISPFFLALVIGDSISGESARGHLKMLLLTPVTRFQILVAKTMAVMTFLMVAVAIGGMFLQGTLWLAKGMTEPPITLPAIPGLGQLGPIGGAGEAESARLLDGATALKLLFLSFVAHLAIIGFFSLLALFSESPILMTFVGLIILMTIQVYYLMSPTLAEFDAVYGTIAEWCFTRHFSGLFEIRVIHGLMDGTRTLGDAGIRENLLGCLGWAAAFFGLSVVVFRRKHILN